MGGIGESVNNIILMEMIRRLSIKCQIILVGILILFLIIFNFI